MTYRRVDTKIWQDPWVESLSSEEKLLFVYLATNECCNQAGLYQISLKRISFECGISVQKIKEYLNSLKPKVVVSENWVWIKNFIKYQCQNESFFSAAKREAVKAPKTLYNEWLNYNTNHSGGTVVTQCTHSDPRNPASVAVTVTVTDTEAVTEAEAVTGTLCSEVEPPSLPNNGNSPVPIVISIPLVSKHGEYQVNQSEVDEWISLFPAVDVLQELRNCKAWNIANPEKRKTPRGIVRHITRWLADKQDQGGRYKKEHTLQGKLTQRGMKNLAVTENWLKERENAEH